MRPATSKQGLPPPRPSNLFFIDNGHTDNLMYQSKNIMTKLTYS